MVDKIVNRWFTLHNFAIFLSAALVVVLSTLAVKGVSRLGGGGSAYPYQIVAMDGSTLDYYLRNMKTLGAVVVLYDSNCMNCSKQLESMLNLRSWQKEGKLELYIVSLDSKPETTMAFLKENDIPESFLTYYTSSEMRNGLYTILNQHGGTGQAGFPHTLLFGSDGRLIVEYKGYVRSSEVTRTLSLSQLQDHSL